MKYFFTAVFLAAAYFQVAFAAEGVKLPYMSGEQFVVTVGYHTPPTHVDKDDYAIDLTQNGCDAYAKPAVAAFSGTAWVVEESGYNGGYGTQLLVLSGGNVVARYAHLIPGSIPIGQGDAVLQGTAVGEIGDTGLVTGTACAEHPGTHIHFAMDMKNDDGSFAAKDPEPISGYTDITAGKWYVSDNVPVAADGSMAELIEILKGLLGGSITIVQPAAPSTTRSSASSNELSAPGSQQVLPVISGVSLPTASASLSADDAPSLVTVVLSQESSTQNDAESGTSSVETRTPVPIAQPGGGSGPIGGISVAVPPALVSTPLAGIPSAVVSVNSSTDDLLDDTVEACEQ